MRLVIPKTNSLVLFFFTLVFVFVRAFDEYTQVITRLVIPSFALVAFFRGGFRNFFSNRLAKIYLLLFVWSLFTIIVASNFDNYIRYSQLFLGIILMIVILESYLKNNVDLFFVLWGIFIGVLGVVIDAVISGDISIRVFGSSDLKRASGIADNPNTLGALLLLGAYSLSVLHLRKRIPTLIYFIFSIFLLFAVLQTASRSAFLGFLMVQIFVIYHSYKSWAFGIRILVIIGSLIVLGLGYNLLLETYQNFLDNTLLGFRIQREDADSDSIRTNLIWIGIGLILNNPIFGVGSGNFTNSNEYGMYSHNDLIEIFANLGIVGFIIYITLLVQTFKLFKGLEKFGGSLAWIGSFGMFFIVLFLVQGLFKPLYIDIFWMFMFFIMVIAARKSILSLKK